MLGIDLGEKAKRTIAGVEWTLGLIPQGKLDEILDGIAAAAAGAPKDLAPDASGADREAFTLAQREASRRIYAGQADLVRWGVKAWSGKNPLGLVPASYGGQSFEVVADERLEALARVVVDVPAAAEGGEPEKRPLISVLAEAVREANNLTLEDVLGF